MNPLKQIPIDKWSTREKLALASSVLTAGDQNWYSVSRSLKPFGEQNRPQDWFSQKNCALQYAELLENVETPKRKRGEKNEDTVQNLIVRKLAMERMNELRDLISRELEECDKWKKGIDFLEDEKISEDKLKELHQIMIDEMEKDKKEEEEHKVWLKQREQKYASMMVGKQKVLTPGARTRQESVSLSFSNPPTPSPAISHEGSLSKDTSKDVVKSTEKPKNAEKEASLTSNQTTTSEIKDASSTDKVEGSMSNEPKLAEAKSKQVNSDSLLSSDKSLSEEPMQVDKKDSEKTSTEADQKVAVKEVAISSTEKNETSTTVASEKKTTEESAKTPNMSSNLTEKEIKKEEMDTNDKLELKESEKATIAKELSETQAYLDGRAEGLKRKRLTASTSNTSGPTRRSGRVKALRPPTEEQDTKTKDSASAAASQTSASSSAAFNATLSDERRVGISEETNDSTTSEGDTERTKGPPSRALSMIESVPNSPASSIFEDPEQMKEYKAWKKAISLLWRQAATHKYSSLFTYPVTDDEAKGYSTVVYRPTDLTQIRKKLENGSIRTTNEFQREMLLMFQNALMYNSVKHEVHQMAVEMQKEIIEAIEDFIESQASTSSSGVVEKTGGTELRSRDQPESSTTISSRRKSRG